MDELLKKSMDNIEKTTRTREVEDQIYVLKETIAEIWCRPLWYVAFTRCT